MSRWISFLIPAVLLAGCAAPPAQDPAEAPEPLVPKQIALPEANLSAKGEPFGLRNADGNWVYVGSSYDEVESHFKKPASAKKIDDLPPKLKPEQFRAWGWTEAGTGDGFGVLVERVSRKAVLLMVTRQKQSVTDLTNLFATYGGHLTDAVGQPQDVGTQTDLIQYRFWEKAPYRLMVCAVTNKSGGFTITVVVGLIPIMDEVGASPDRAANDFASGQTLLDNAKKPATTTSGTNQPGS